jgi:Ca-activated chloride channel homolog
MGFLLPLGFLFALSIPVLVLFYLLKVRRRPRRVSSTWLWRETVEDARASVPFQRLRRNLLMLLQILILALLTLALARPILNLRIGKPAAC